MPPPDIDEKEIPSFVTMQLATLEHQISVLALSTRWSMDHVYEGLTELRVALRNVCPINPVNSKPGSAASAVSSNAPTETPEALENVRQQTERLESLVRSACTSVLERSTNQDKTMSAVQNIATTLATLEGLVRQRLPASYDAAPRSEEVHPAGGPYEHAYVHGGRPAEDNGHVSKGNGMKSEGAAPAELAAQLALWMEYSTDRFHVQVFVKEVVVQAVFYTGGLLCVPILYLCYGNLIALINRAFVPVGCGGVFLLQTFSALCMLSALAIYFVTGHQTGETDIVELMVAFGGIVMHCVAIAFKYAYMPAPVYHMYNTTKVPPAKINEHLLVASWFIVPDHVCHRAVDAAMMSVLGPGESGPLLSFIPEPRTAEELMVPSRLQGKMTRSMVADVLLNGNMKECPSVNDDIDFGPDLSSSGVSSDWKTKLQPYTADGVPIADIFRFMTQVVLEHEARCSFRKIAILIPIVTLLSCLMPGLARWRVHGLFFGNTWSSAAISALTFFANFQHWGAFFSFLYIACVELIRRRTLVLCLCALLSNRWEDRKSVPAPIRELGILDLRDVQSIMGVRALRELCVEWGKFYSLRCFKCVEASILGSGTYVGIFIFLAENEMYSYISELLVMIVIHMSLFQTIAMIGSAVLGQQLNGATSRCFYLLNHHRTSMSLAKYQDWCTDADGLEASASCIGIVADNMQMEQDTNPFTLLGLPLGFGLLSSLYLVAGLVAQRLLAYCQAEPYMCFLSNEMINSTLSELNDLE